MHQTAEVSFSHLLFSTTERAIPLRRVCHQKVFHPHTIVCEQLWVVCILVWQMFVSIVRTVKYQDWWLPVRSLVPRCWEASCIWCGTKQCFVNIRRSVCRL